MEKQFVMLLGRLGAAIHTVDREGDALTTCGLRRDGLQRTFNWMPDLFCRSCVFTDGLRVVQEVTS